MKYLSLEQEIRTNIISLDVIFIYANTSYIYYQLNIEQNAVLKTFLEICKQKLQSMNENNGTIQYIEIGDKKYDQRDSRNLKDLGTKNRSQIKIHICNRSFLNQQKKIQYQIKAEKQEQLISNYKNILFSSLEQKQQKSIEGLEQEILIQTFSIPELNQTQKNDKSFKDSKYHVINNAFRRNVEQKKLSNSIIEPQIVIQQQLFDETDMNQDIVIFVLSEQLKQSGQKLYYTKQHDQLNLISLQASFVYGLDDATCMQLTIKNNKEISYQQLKDHQYFLNFQTQLKYELAKQFNTSPDDIHLLSIEEGSIKVYFQITNQAGVSEQIEWNHSINQIHEKYPDARLVLHNYFKEIQLSAYDFDPKFNIEWDVNYKEFELRGPKQDQIKYFFPRGWKGYALQVKGKYDDGNNDWLAMNSNPNQWHIMYHGTSQFQVQGILEQGLKPGRRQSYKDHTDIRNQEIVGSGVYFSNHIEVAQIYVNPITIDCTNYQVVFQSRVNPLKLKQIQKKCDLEDRQGNPDWDNDYFVVNEPGDIRPYRILLKKKKKLVKLIKPNYIYIKQNKKIFQFYKKQTLFIPRYFFFYILILTEWEYHEFKFRFPNRTNEVYFSRGCQRLCFRLKMNLLFHHIELNNLSTRYQQVKGIDAKKHFKNLQIKTKCTQITIILEYVSKQS